MNRDIKFRIWKPESKRMDYVELENYLGGAGIYDQKIGCNEQGKIWMQYTGLKDKNGKEIYEGDVIKYMPRFGDKYRVEQVYWQDFRACFATKRSEHANNDLYHAVNYGNECTIIGNIYQNPDLLTK